MSEPSNKPGFMESNPPVEEALARLHADFSEIAERVTLLPPGHSPSGYVMLELVWPHEMEGEMASPHQFLAAMKLEAVGKGFRAVAPGRLSDPDRAGMRYAPCLKVIGRKNHIAAIPAKIKALEASSPVAQEMAGLKSALIAETESRLFIETGPTLPAGTEELFEADLLPFPGHKTRFPQEAFARLAEEQGFKIIQARKSANTGHLDVLISGPRENLINLAEFSMCWRIKGPKSPKPLKGR